MNRRQFAFTTAGAVAAALTPLTAFAGFHLIDPVAIHYKRGQNRTWNAAEMRYDYTGPIVQYRALCLLRSDGLAAAFVTPMTVSLAAAKADACAQLLGVRNAIPPMVLVPRMGGFATGVPMTAATFRIWTQELQAEVGGW